MDEGQLRMENFLAYSINEVYENQGEILNGMMKPKAVSCSYEEGSVTILFPCQKWQANRVGNLHGGVYAAAIDFATAVLARFYAGENFAPSISIDIKYIRPMQVTDKMIVRAKATAAGKRVTQTYAEVFSEQSGKLTATGAAVLLNVDTMKERQK